MELVSYECSKCGEWLDLNTKLVDRFQKAGVLKELIRCPMCKNRMEKVDMRTAECVG